MFSVFISDLGLGSKAAGGRPLARRSGVKPSRSVRPTPWDYCCTPSEQLLPNPASVQILGPDASALTVDLDTVADLKPMSVLVIQGTVGPRPDNATLTINGTGIFVASRPVWEQTMRATVLVMSVLIAGCASVPDTDEVPPIGALGRNLPTFRTSRTAEPARPPKAEPSGDLTLRQALALLHNPKLEADAWEIRDKETAILQSHLSPNPILGAQGGECRWRRRAARVRQRDHHAAHQPGHRTGGQATHTHTAGPALT